jgi:hypothetical protein
VCGIGVSGRREVGVDNWTEDARTEEVTVSVWWRMELDMMLSRDDENACWNVEVEP